MSADEWKTTYINTKDNLSDILTKNPPVGTHRYCKIFMFLYDIYPMIDGESNKTTI